MTQHPDLATFPIGAVARATGLTTHAIRVWERRYGAVQPKRTAGGSRMYSEDDIARLSLLKRLTEAGHSIGQIAALPTPQLSGLLAATHGPTDKPDGFAVRFLDALSAFDLATAERVLAHAASVLPPRELAYDVIGPVARAVGDRWEAGELRVFQEHAASALLRNNVGAVLRARGASPDAPMAVVGTPMGELHEFGALLAALIASTCGWRVVYLGCNLPAAEILAAVREGRAGALLLSVVNARTEQTAFELRALARELSAEVELIIGGAAAPDYADVAGRAHLETELRQLEPLLGQLAFRRGVQ